MVKIKILFFESSLQVSKYYVTFKVVKEHNEYLYQPVFVG
jgi:hypothetical protein